MSSSKIFFIFGNLSKHCVVWYNREKNAVLCRQRCQEVCVVEDLDIIQLYWQRDERAVAETEQKYGAYCRSISYGILRNHQDAEECVNDTLVKAWNAIPPQRPFALGAFLGTIARNLSLNRYRMARTQRRGGGTVPLILEELRDCTADGPEQLLEAAELGRVLDRFLRRLPQKECCIFMRRYWYMDSLEDIARRYHLPMGSVKSSLFRCRRKLKEYLEQEGIPT